MEYIKIKPREEIMELSLRKPTPKEVTEPRNSTVVGNRVIALPGKMY